MIDLKKRYFILTLGCQMNKSDGERVAAILDRMDYIETSVESEADLILVMACSVRQSAIDRVHGKARVLQSWKQQRPLLTALSGCVLPNDKPKFEKVFDIMFNVPEMERLPELIAGQMKETEDVIPSSHYFKIAPKRRSGASAWVTIMTGCNQHCTYCAVPYTRGKELSRSADGILQEIQELVDAGYKEITILGQTIDAYINPDKGHRVRNFADLLNAIGEIRGDYWLRFLTSHPNFMLPSVLHAIAANPQITPYIHLPVQAGSNVVLKRMNRKYSREHYLKVIQHIRDILPHVALTTDMIVGFCGETQQDFDETLSLYHTVQYDMAYTAQYSPRVGTVGARWADDVPKEEKVRREKQLNEVVETYAYQQNSAAVGTQQRVLLETNNSSYFLGRNVQNKKVKVLNEPGLRVGDFCDVMIERALSFGLVGRPLGIKRELVQSIDTARQTRFV